MKVTFSLDEKAQFLLLLLRTFETTGQDSKDLMVYVISSHRWTDSVNRRLIQGIIACCVQGAASRPSAIPLPRRYIAALIKVGVLLSWMKMITLTYILSDVSV